MRIDWDEIREEAVRCLSEYLRIDTTNPPGAEKLAVAFLEQKLQGEGLDVQTFAADPERPNLVCRLKGDGSQQPLVLLHHMDVVPAERNKWSVDPFSGEVKDGFVWGRGALDVKGLGVMHLLAFLSAHRQALPLKRDLIYVATPDEETGGRVGAQWLVDHHAEQVTAEYLFTEGGAGWRRDERLGFSVGIGEKGPLFLRVSAHGTAGHGSKPVADNAGFRLARALSRVGDYRSPIQIVPEMKHFLRKIGVDPEIAPEELADHELMGEPATAAMFANTISLTMLRAGERVNVIPSEAEATLDCRLLPGETAADFMETLREVIADDGVTLSVINAYEPSASAVATDLFRALEEAINEHYPGVPVLPTVSTGFTDSRCFRKLGTTCYGLLPFVTPAEILATIHGHDERIAEDSLLQGTRVTLGLIERLCL